MKQLFYHIKYWAPVIMLVLLSVASATAQKAVPHFEVTQCDTLQFEIEEFPGDEYTWDLYHDAEGNFAVEQGDMESAIYFEEGMYRGARVRVLNLPAGEYFLRVMAWDEIKCTNNLMVFKMEVIEPPPPEVIGDSVCIGDVPLVRVIFTGNGPWDFEYAYGDGVNTVNMIGHTDDPEITIPITEPLPVGEHTFWVISVNDCVAKEYPVEDRPNTGILIFPKPTNSIIYLKDD